MSEQEEDHQSSLEMRLHDPAFFFAYQVAELASRFLAASPDEIDELINQSISTIGRFIDVDRAYVFSVSEDNKTISNTHEWCNSGVSTHIHELQNLPLDDFPYLKEKIEHNQIIKISDLSAFEDDPELRGHLEAQGIKSLLVLPMYYDEHAIGFIGLDVVNEPQRWSSANFIYLKLLAEVIVNSLVRDKQAREIRNTQNHLLETQKIAHLGTYTLDITSGTWTSSEILDDIFGIDPQTEHSIELWINVLHPQWRERMMSYFFDEVIGQGKRFDMEYQVIRVSDSRPIWIHGIGELEFNDDGQPIRMIGTIRDITEEKEAELEIRDNEARFRNLFEQSSEGILLATLDGQIVDANRKWLEMFAYQQHELKNLMLADLHPEDTKWLVSQSIDELVTTGSSNFTTSCIRKNGERFLSEISASLIEYQGKQLIQSIERDITSKKETEEWLKKLSMAVEQSPVSVVITDPDGNIEYTNQHFEKVTGYSREEVLGENPRILKSDETPEEEYKVLWETISSGNEWEGEFKNKHKDGSLYWEYGHISPIFNEEGEITNYLGVKENVTLKKEYEQKILQQAHYDALTGLPNRFLVMDRLKQAIAQSMRTQSSMALMYIDLDDFKKVNDTMGHQAGDTILIDAAQRLRYMIREGDTVGRLGGDEFVVVLGQISAYADAEIVAEKILRAFNKPFLLDNVEIVLTTSIGIAMFPHDSKDEQQLMRNADTAMYRSKDEGRNTYNFFDESMKTEVLRRLEVEHQLRYALSNNEFHMMFQPIMDLASGATSGAEALIRWNNPELGMVAPDEFIPLSEQTGLINEIGHFVLHESCRAMQRINKATGENYYLAINISPHQFRKSDFVAQVAKALDETGFPADLLEIEITEGLLLQMNDTINEAFHQLHSMGIKFSMDDFGTGYSSLSYLRNFPFDVLKIDRTFVGDLSNNPEDKALISATIAMARNLGLTVIGEGVEDTTQLGILRDEACQRAQGYLFSHPMLEQDFISWIMSQRSRVSN